MTDYLLIALLAVGASFVERTTGFGFGIFIMTVLPFLMPSYGEATTLSGLLALTTTLIICSRMWKLIIWRHLWPILITFIVVSGGAVFMLSRMQIRSLTMSLGIILGFDRQNITRDSWGPVDPTLWGATNYVGTRKMSYNTITITPYFRYNAMKLNNLTLFCEASIPVSIKTADKIVVNEEGDVAGTHVTATTTTIDNKVTSFGLTITPGFNYALNEHLSLDMYLNAINLGFIMSKTKTSADSFENNVSVDTDINWGLNIHTLPTAAVSFGINYAF